MFILVRHALAVNKRWWTGSDQMRPLSLRGLQQSRDLVTLLTKFGVTRLLSSPTVRCRQTLTPVSEEIWVPIEPVGALGVDAPVDDLLNLLNSPEIETAVLCTHGETLNALSQAWQRSWPMVMGLRSPDLTDTPKGGCWVVEGYNTAGAFARYLGSTTR